LPTSQLKFILPVEIESQPTDSTCGATCLQAIYKYWGKTATVPEIVEQIPQFETGGTLAVELACHALNNGFSATIYTYNLQVFDPTWFQIAQTDLAAKLSLQRELKAESNPRLAIATEVYLRFLSLGGEVRMQPLERPLIKQHLLAGLPLLAGLSATFLYQESRERPQVPDEHGISSVGDDVGGEPAGHFVVLSGYDDEADTVLINDPLHPNPASPSRNYWSANDHVAAAILLGILTYDANLLVVQPKPV
jgi:hypothetical protein